MAGPAPSVAECDTMLSNACHILEEALKAGSENAENFLDLKDTFTQALESQYSAQMEAAVATLESRFASVVAEPRLLLDPIMLTYGKAIAKPSSDPLELARVLLPRYFTDNSKTIKERGVSHGSPTMDGGNTGDGLIDACTVTPDNDTIENIYAEAWRAEVDRDSAAGAQRNREEFKLEGAHAHPNELQRTGSGFVGRLICRDWRDSLVANAGFDQFGGTTSAPTSITNWTSTATVNGTNFDLDSTNIYHPKRKTSENRYALNIKATATLTQRLDLRGRGVDFNRPYYIQLAWNRAVGSGSGTLELHMGTHSASVAVSAQTGWQTLVPTVGQNSWPINFNEDQLDIKIVWTRTAGDLLIDDLIFVPFEPAAGQWLVAVGGQTPFVERDFATWTNTATGSVIQRWLWRAYDVTWPHASSPTIADP